MRHTERILEALRRGPVEAIDLHGLLWGDSDGPEWPDSNLRAQIWRLNHLLRPEGLKVISHRRPRMRGRYELVRIDQGVPHKLFSDGVCPS